MAVLDDVKELERRAKESDFWKEKYSALLSRLNDFISGMQEFREFSVSKRAKSYGSYPDAKVVDELYVALKSEKVFELDSFYVKSFLESKNLTNHNAIIYSILNDLKERDGIKTRKAGQTVKLFYVKDADDKRDKEQELLRMFPKGKICVKT